jgi:hypothetical protein
MISEAVVLHSPDLPELTKGRVLWRTNTSGKRDFVANAITLYFQNSLFLTFDFFD